MGAAEDKAAKQEQDKNVQANAADATLPSEKDVNERTAEEQKAAEKTARAAVAQEEFERAQAAEEEARKLANKNDKGEKPLNFADKIIAEKLAHGGSPEAKAAENENNVLMQQIYQQAGLSATEVLATAKKD